MRLLRSGSVRDLYAAEGDLLIVTSDRVAVNGIVFPTPIPGKGRLLTALSSWWFDRLGHVAPNHVVSNTDVPAEFAGRAIRCRRLAMIPVELIARGYLAGAGFDEYQTSGTVAGIPMPPGLTKGSRLPRPIFSPAWKGSSGESDSPTNFETLADHTGIDVARRLRRMALDVYRFGADLARERGLIVADTKIEVGWASDGGLVLADEILTCDSSRFWLASRWTPGSALFALDRQFIRDWAAETGWCGEAPAPEIPPDIVKTVQRRYIMAYERITDLRWSANGGSPAG